MTKHEAFKQFVESTEITIPRFTGTDDGGLSFLDQPDSWENATAEEVAAAKKRAIEISNTITAEQTRGYKLASLVASAARKRGDNDAAHIADMVDGVHEYVVADLVAEKK